MRNLIFGIIGVLWGGGILISYLIRGGPQGSGAYAGAEIAGLVIGVLLFLAGIYYLIDGVRKLLDAPTKKRRKRKRRRPEPEDDYDD
jgi:hypothetical protein